MDFTPSQRFYSASMTAKLVESPMGIIEPSTKTNSIKTKHIFYGILAVGAIFAGVVLVAEIKKRSLSEDKLNV